MYSIAVGNGIFVAVGHAGLGYMPGTAQKGTITNGQGEVAQLTGLAWVSQDGHDWSGYIVKPDFDDAGPEAIASTGAGFVAVGHANTENPHAAAWTSSDGSNWYRVPDGPAFAGPPGGGGSAIWAVGADDHGLVAVGHEWTLSNGQLSGSRAMAWTSSDGQSWTRANAIVDGEGGGFNAVVGGGPGWIAGGETGPAPGRAAIWTSADGTHWSRVPASPDFPNGAVEAIARGGSGFVAVGLTFDAVGTGLPAVWTSPDGTAWHSVPTDLVTGGRQTEGVMTSVTAGGPGLVAVGFAVNPLRTRWHGVVWTSSDGRTWAESSDLAAFSGGAIGPVWNGPLSVAANGSAIVAVGSTLDAPAAIWANLAAP